jgi:hydroxyacyl-ACP dehydratase HTD2-like protein with hotdog domain
MNDSLSREITSTELQLFLFSAACWLPHRIHYDLSYARKEGYDGVVVQGPLQVAHILDLAEEMSAGTASEMLTVKLRFLGVAHPQQTLVCSLERDQDIHDAVALRVAIARRADGGRIAEGSIRFDPISPIACESPL